MKTIETQLIDSDGDHLIHPRPFDNQKEARQWCKEYSRDRHYWVRHAESEVFPDTIESFVVLVNGEIVSEFSPKF